MDNLLIIGLQFPEPKSTAAGSRMLQIIELLKSFGFKIHFACAQPHTEFSTDLTSLSVTEHHIQLNNPSVDVLLQKLNPKVVVFDRFVTEEQFGWRIDEQSPKALKILDTEDLHFLREARERDLKQASNYKKTLSDRAKRELAAIYRCDWTLMISKVEIEILTQAYAIPKNLLFYLPFVYDLHDLKTEKFYTYDQRQHFMSIGNFKHKPNLDMVNFLCQDIWPKIRQALPQAEWHVYGAYVPESVQQWHNLKKGIVVKGRADEVLSTLQSYKVMLAPLRFGAGLKGKCLDSMLSGTPSVTTDIGAEGITDSDDWPGFVENQPVAFAQKAIELYTNKSLWEQKQKQGIDVLKQNFDKIDFAETFKTKLLEIIQNLDNHRQDNTVGELLKHHHHRSTKFMSLWIEEKNRDENP